LSKVYDTAVCHDAPHVAMGLCSTCYQRMRKAVRAGAEIPDHIAEVTSLHAQRKMQARFDRATASAAKRAARNKATGYSRSSTLKYRYGITQGDFDRLLAAQRGCCAVCEEPQGVRALNVDHDHATGATRGLLCSSCNQMVGVIENFARLFPAANDYLSRYRA
jgi:hypothetical protein